MQVESNCATQEASAGSKDTLLPEEIMMTDDELASANDHELVKLLYSKATPEALGSRVQEELNVRATARLHECWSAFREKHAKVVGPEQDQRKRLMTQKEFVENYVNPRFGAKWKQSNFSQYLNGGMIGPRPMTIFCTIFGVMPGDIRKELAHSAISSEVTQLKKTVERTIATIKEGADDIDLNQVVMTLESGLEKVRNY